LSGLAKPLPSAMNPHHRPAPAAMHHVDDLERIDRDAAELPAGDEVELVVLRDGRAVTLRTTLGSRG
jgi:hypothetical protein